MTSNVVLEERKCWNGTYILARNLSTPPPSRQTTHRLRNKFDKTGLVNNAPKSGLPKTSTTKKSKTLVALTLINSPKKFPRRASAELSTSRTSLLRLLHSMKFNPYRQILIHGLLESEPDRRLQFCKMKCDQFVGEQVEKLDKIKWSDEACIKLSRYVKKHDYVYWADDKLNLTIEIQLHQPGVTVWGALSSEDVLETVFFMEVCMKNPVWKCFVKWKCHNSIPNLTFMNSSFSKMRHLHNMR